MSATNFCEPEASISVATDAGHLACVLDSLHLLMTSEADKALLCSTGFRGANGEDPIRWQKCGGSVRNDSNDPFSPLWPLALETFEILATVAERRGTRVGTGTEMNDFELAAGAAVAGAVRLLALMVSLPTLPAPTVPLQHLASALSRFLVACPLTDRLARAIRAVVCQNAAQTRFNSWFPSGAGGAARELRRALADERIALLCVEGARRTITEDMAKRDDRITPKGIPRPSCDGAQRSCTGDASDESSCGASWDEAVSTSCSFRTLCKSVEAIVRALEGPGACKSEAVAELRMLTGLGAPYQKQGEDNGDYDTRGNSVNSALKNFSRNIRRSCMGPTE
jgi:hypothetical protein